ncbi:hypothetical protein PG989_002987 [Apiospora arundinis]
MESPPPQSLPSNSPPMVSDQVSSPSTFSEHSTGSERSRAKNEKKYQELEPMVTDESMRLPSGKYQCPWVENGVSCLNQEDIPRDMNKHLRWHQRPVLCPQHDNKEAPCLVRTPQQRDMARHVKTHHTSRKGVDSKYKCRVCKKGFARKDHLKRHMDKIACGT